MKPSVTWTSPFNITSSAQISIKAPTGGFVIDNEVALVSGTNWQHNATYIAPLEAPTYDYFSFGMLSLGTNAYNYQAGVEIAVLEFENVGTCTGGVLLLEDNDPFLPPNSQSANVGNQITILGAGPGNAWVGNYDVGQADCSGNSGGGGPITCSVDDVTSTNPTDCGLADGTITIDATTSSSVLEYSIDNGANWQTSNTFTGRPSGSYTVLVQVQGGSCSASYANNPVVLSEPQAPSIVGVTANDPTDCGVADGSITAIVSGGTGSYEYQLNSNGWVTTPTFTSLPSGIYTVSVRNDDGTCIVSQNTSLHPPSAPSVTSVLITDPSACGVANGSIEINVTGGTGSYEFSTNGTSWSTNNVYQNLGEGTVDVYVRNDNGTCEVQGNAVTLNAPDELSVMVVRTNPSACGLLDGEIFATASGGSGSYSYSIDNGINWSLSGNFQNLDDGNYTVLARNNNLSCQTAYPNNPVSLTDPACPGACVIEYELEQLPSGVYQVSLISNVTWNAPLNITSTAQVTVVAPTGGFSVNNLMNLVPGATFNNNSNYVAPLEAPSRDYFVFGLTSQGTSAISYQQGVKVPLFTFENGGSCAGDSIHLMQINDPFMPPNSESANIGQQLTTLGSGPDADICISEPKVPCDAPQVNESCIIAYQLELLPNGHYQVSMTPDTTWAYPQSITSTAQVTVVAPAGSLVIDSLTNLIPSVTFGNNANYPTPIENPNKDYFLFGLVSNGTSNISYEKGVKVPLFTFKNVGECTGDSIYLMPIEGDPFELPNSESANVGQQLTTLGSGSDANICIIGEGVLCVPCGPNMVDTDDDGICDNEELATGSNPNDPCDPDISNANCDYTCQELFDQDTIIWLVGTDSLAICLDIPTTEIGFYDVIVNQAPYTQPATYCSLDTLTFYSYAFTVGQGADGPYEVVAWEVEGEVFSGLIPNMDALADSMNVWNPVGNWANTPNFAAVSGGLEGMAYGNMEIRHVASGVVTFIQTNITFIGADSKVNIDNVGENELIVTDPNTGCSDTLIIQIYDPQNDTTEVDYPVDSTSIEICMDTAELPGGPYTTSICGQPMNGTVSVTGEGCIEYITNPQYNGFDTVCVVVCSQTDPIICDTTIVVINVMQHVCEDLLPSEPIYLQGNNGQATYCAPIPTMSMVTSEIILDQSNYILPTMPCAYDTLIFYTYAFTVGQGNDGPYEVDSWTVNGTDFSGIAANMNELASMMSIWDPTGNWQNTGAFSAISGGDNNNDYGKMNLRHVDSNVPTTIQANYTAVGTHTELTISGLGWHELIFNDLVTGCADTADIFIVETTPETITEIHPNGTTSVGICMDTDELTGNSAHISLCGQPTNGTVVTNSFSCLQYFPDNGFVGEDNFCVVICDDNPYGPFCDTTYVNVIILPTTDTLPVTISPVDPTEVCVDGLHDFPGTMVSASICGEDPNAVDAEISTGACVTLDPADDFVGDAEVCVVHCFESMVSATVICDTSYIEVFVLPKPDTIYVEITDFNPVDTCVTDVVGLPGNIATVSICGETTDEVDATILPNGCVSLEQATGFLNGVSEVCVVHCDDNNPTICDTTYIIVTVDIECPEIFTEDTVYVTEPALCTSINMDDIDFYDIIVNGAPYQFPPLPCAEDITTFYSYSFTFGSGASGPYEVVSWDVGGTVYSGVVQSMDALVLQMNAWDLNGNWQNEGNSLSVLNLNGHEDAEDIYGNMVLRHIGSGVSTTMLPNFTNIAMGSEIRLGTYGLHEVVLIDKETLCSDTIYVHVVDVTTDTIAVVTESGTPTNPICSDVTGLPGNLTHSICSPPQNGTTIMVPTSCLQYVPGSGFAGGDDFCMVVCSDILDQNGDPICDTTYVQVIVLPAIDETDVTTTEGEDIEVCLDDEQDIDGPITSSGICGFDPSQATVSMGSGSCITLEPVGDFVGQTEVCVYHCYDIFGETICDTTYVNLMVEPSKDTIYVDIIGFDPENICLEDEGVLNLSGLITSAWVCGENVNEVDLATSNNDCLTIDPVDLFMGTSEACVVHCDGTVCDTTIVIVDVSFPCEDVWAEDTVVVQVDKFCIPIDFSDIHIFDILVNGADYAFPPEPCDEDSLVYYTYSFTVGAGTAGPYNVDWNLYGTNYTTSVQDMDDLTSWMNQIDPNGNWYNELATKSISNVEAHSGYGIMTVTQVSTNIPAILQSNYTAVAYGSEIYFTEPGLHEVVVIDGQTGCMDTIYVWYADTAPSTVVATVPNATTSEEFCLDADGLPGDVANVTLCGSPQNGTVNFDGDCFDYTPTGFFTGVDQFCVVVCDDTPAPWGAFCDTVYFEITVEGPDCISLFDQLVYEIEAENGIDSADFCVPINPQDLNTFDILVNNAPYTYPPASCDLDTKIFYTYSFTVGGGAAGPYEVSTWAVDGVSYTTTVQDMAALVTWMNQIDGAAGWTLDPGTFSVVGTVLSNKVYGNMIMKHIGTQIPSTLLPNFTQVAFGSTLTLPIGTNNVVITNNETGCVDEVTVVVTESVQELIVASRVFLQGAYAGNGTMQDQLRQNNYLPLIEPYTDYNPIANVYSFIHVNSGGGEMTTTDVFSETGSDAIVDWVFLELRAGYDSVEVVATRSALVQRDGDIVDMDGFSPVSFSAPDGDYYLAVRHRNHLGIMTEKALSLSNVVMSVDFTDPNTGVWGTYARKDLGDGYMAMISGDANANGNLAFQGANNDPDAVFFQVLLAPGNTSASKDYVISGYHHGDTNMDGRVIYQGANNDIDFTMFFNVLQSPENPQVIINKVITEKLP